MTTTMFDYVKKFGGLGTGSNDDETYSKYQAFCEQGTYHFNHALCRLCEEGKYDNMNWDGARWTIKSCKNCPAGQYQNEWGSKSCKSCGAGKYSGSASSGCTQCAKGRYNNQQRQGSCKSCSAGKYQDQIGKRSCKICSKGKYQHNTEKTSCIDCAKGKYQFETGQTSEAACKECHVGRYSNTEGNSKFSHPRTTSICHHQSPPTLWMN